MLKDPGQVDDVSRKYRWSMEDETRLNTLNEQAKSLQMPKKWSWAAKEGTAQYEYNKRRMEFFVEYELETKVRHCENCKATGILVGRDQVESKFCYDCMTDRKQGARKKEFFDAWNAVRPSSIDHHGLPQLYPGDKAVISLVHPVVTIRKHYMMNTKLRQESITLLNDCNATWTRILPRSDLQDRFVVIERTKKDHSRRHIVANPARVKTWLQFLFANHPDFIRMKSDGELQMSDQALAALESQSELGEVMEDVEEGDDDNTETESGIIVQPAMESGLSSSDVFTFDRYPYLYVKTKDFMRITQDSKIEIIDDRQERVPIYNASATAAFPHLYLNGEKSALDFSDWKLTRCLLKRQSLFAYKLDVDRYNQIVKNRQ